MTPLKRTFAQQVFGIAAWLATGIKELADSLIDWMYVNGQVDKLAMLTTNTAGVRSAALAAASFATAHGMFHGSLSETMLSVIVLLVTWALNSFVQYARNRHNREVQQAVIDAGISLKPDAFIGRKTVEGVKEAINAQPPAPPVE